MDLGPLFVTGCHRSGTSLLSSLLKKALIGEKAYSENDLELKLENPKGFFESKRLVDFNDHMLSTIGCSWDAPPLLSPAWDSPTWIKEFEAKREGMQDYALRNNWIDKDPRLCITYPAYLHILLKRVPLVGIIRRPLEVATSLYARNGLPLNSGLALWFIYNFHLSYSIDYGDIILLYDDLLKLKDRNMAEYTFSKLSSFLEGNDYLIPSASDWDDSIETSLLTSLNRSANVTHLNCSGQINSYLLKDCNEAYDSFESSSSSIKNFKKIFDSIPRNVLLNLTLNEEKYNSSSLDQDNNSSLNDESLFVNKRRITQLENEISQIKNSNSWRLTAPLRRFKNLLRLF